MIRNIKHIENKGSYTDLRVLHSMAGYYVGTLYEERDKNGNLVFQEPGSRDSDYFRKEEQATRFLRQLEGLGDGIAEAALRQRP